MNGRPAITQTGCPLKVPHHRSGKAGARALLIVHCCISSTEGQQRKKGLVFVLFSSLCCSSLFCSAFPFSGSGNAPHLPPPSFGASKLCLSLLFNSGYCLHTHPPHALSNDFTKAHLLHRFVERPLPRGESVQGFQPFPSARRKTAPSSITTLKAPLGQIPVL